MLKKLLKYDFKAMLKLWWIAAAAALLLSFAGALFVRILDSERNFPAVVYTMAILSMIVVMLSWITFAIISFIVIYGRFYKNFFTDEGYLTFTLPVTKGQLFNSKLISMYVVELLTGLTMVLCFFAMFGLGIGSLLPDMWEEISELVKSVWDGAKEVGARGWIIVWLVEYLVILLLGVLFSLLFTTNCITFGCIVAKKAKLAASIGIYFGANWLFSGAMQIFMMFGTTSLSTWLSEINPETQVGCLLAAMVLFCGVIIMGLMCSLLYTLQYWMLDRKLNLP